MTLQKSLRMKAMQNVVNKRKNSRKVAYNVKASNISLQQKRYIPFYKRDLIATIAIQKAFRKSKGYARKQTLDKIKKCKTEQAKVRNLPLNTQYLITTRRSRLPIPLNVTNRIASLGPIKGRKRLLDNK